MLNEPVGLGREGRRQYQPCGFTPVAASEEILQVRDIYLTKMRSTLQSRMRENTVRPGFWDFVGIEEATDSYL